MMRTLVSLLLVIAVGALAALDWLLITTPVDISPIEPSGTAAPPSARNDSPRRLMLDDTTTANFPDTSARPLFWPERRPVRPVGIASEPAAATTPPAPIELRVAGIHVDGKGRRRALIVAPGQPLEQWIDEGGEVDGWTLTRISRDAILLEAGGRSEELRLPSAR
ncbi:MAG: hypothetical protein SFW09_10370 [Hyphomicrobiaceae bacterium]|nr:hypothetical protein [Hyphomicrobiaceae bacterium]